MNNESGKEQKKDLKTQIMEDIKCKRVRMRSRIVFVVEKLGLQGALLLMILSGAILISLVFFFVENIKLERFLTMGMPGVSVFFLTLPYDYILLFILAVAMAIYFANQIALFCGNCENTDKFAAWFFLGSLALGVFFGSLGVGSFLGGWSHNKIPHKAAIHGQIQYFSGDSVVIVDDEGDAVEILSATPPMPDPYMLDKFLRAVGHRDEVNPLIFHADRVRCCDDD